MKSAVDVFVGDATTYTADQKFDFACVNILSPILCAHAERIIGWVRPDGLLALAGILSQDFDNLSKVFTEAGAIELERFTEKEWTSGLFRRVK
jgi:ribosomal protein L11 methyltransferase